jgi:hypothetical protein
MLVLELVSELANMRAFVKELASERAFDGREDTPETEEDEESSVGFGLLMMKIFRFNDARLISLTHEHKFSKV